MIIYSISENYCRRIYLKLAKNLVAWRDGICHPVQMGINPHRHQSVLATAGGNLGNNSMIRIAVRARPLVMGVSIVIGTVLPAWSHGITERVSVGRGGTQADGDSGSPAISADGRFVAFVSVATNLVPGDTNAQADIFVYDRHMEKIERVSLGPRGIQSDRSCSNPVISADGRFVAFHTDASNLVAGDTNGVEDVFIRDRKAGTTERVSIGPGSVQGNDYSSFPSISPDGRFVSFFSLARTLVQGDTNGLEDVFIRDRQKGETHRANLGVGGVQANGQSFGSAISADGRFVAFYSGAENLVRQDNNHTADIFIRDRKRAITDLVSVSSTGIQGNGASAGHVAITSDGRFIVFTSASDNLVPGDTNGISDIFVHDRKTGTTERASVGQRGVQILNEEGYIGPSAISANGRFVTFFSRSSGFVPGDTNVAFDVFVRHRTTGRTWRVSLGPGDVQGNSRSKDSAISADGRFVAFWSDATNLVPGDTNGQADIFVRSLVP